MREKAIRECEKYFNGDMTMGSLVRFVKQRMELPL